MLFGSKKIILSCVCPCNIILHDMYAQLSTGIPCFVYEHVNIFFVHCNMQLRRKVSKVAHVMYVQFNNFQYMHTCTYPIIVYYNTN